MTPQTQFTPGPWTVKRGERCLFIYDSREDVPSIAHLGRTGLDHDDEANARLIASAPSLYAALQAMLECAEIGDLESLANAAVNARKALDLANA